MPQVHSRDFGVLDYPPESVITFPRGLPGFEDQHRFVLIEQEALAPAVVLQGADSLDLSFLAVPVSTVDANYQIGICGEDLRLLELDERWQPIVGVEILCVAILSVPEHGGLSANLLAPIVVNLKTRVGVQAVREDGAYSHCHPFEGSVGAQPC